MSYYYEDNIAISPLFFQQRVLSTLHIHCTVFCDKPNNRNIIFHVRVTPKVPNEAKPCVKTLIGYISVPIFFKPFAQTTTPHTYFSDIYRFHLSFSRLQIAGRRGGTRCSTKTTKILSWKEIAVEYYFVQMKEYGQTIIYYFTKISPTNNHDKQDFKRGLIL